MGVGKVNLKINSLKTTSLLSVQTNKALFIDKNNTVLYKLTPLTL